jgi:RHS repeat-associated protein
MGIGFAQTLGKAGSKRGAIAHNETSHCALSTASRPLPHSRNDSFARVRTFTDSEGWTVTYDYDAADRITRKTYPDGTFESYGYNKLDLVSYTDREAKTWTYAYDANRRLTSTTDPSGNQTQYGYNRSSQVTSLTDPRTNVTQWAYDVQGRLSLKQYPDTSTVAYTYETTTSRLKSVTDALSQVKTYGYARDDRLTAITYTGAVNLTPNVSFTYDPWFPRLAAMTDGTGTRQYAYVPVGSPGALQLQQESGPLPLSAITSAYDALGRMSSRTVQGAGAETFQYDALGRLTVHASDLGTFNLGYLGQTDQIASRQLASSTLATAWSYLTNTNDRRLSGIANTGLTAGQFSNFTYTTTPDFISGITESSDTSAVYPAAASQTATYNTLNQLTNLSGQPLTYDANGNLTADGQRTYAWDAENRLVGIGYPGVSGNATAFTYDGLGRRATVSSTPPGGGSATVTSYLWCGDDICQARNAGNTTLRSYYDEGEYLPGPPAQTLYYGTDQIRSVRRVFASTTSAVAYAYDPYGAPLQATAPTTDFGYAGMFFNADSGLYLTNYRAFNSVAGRWMSRDPIGEASDPQANLYAYVYGNPLAYIDPFGLEGEGHHWVPKSIYEKQNIPPEASKIFDKGTTGPLTLHQYDGPHRLYNQGAKELWERLLKERNIDPSKMTPDQAKDILEEFKKCPDQKMKPLQRQIWNRALKDALRRIPIRGVDQ